MEALLLVVSKTRMGKLVCIGGLIHNPDGTLRSVRLMKDNGWNHNETEAEDFTIGSLYIGKFGEKDSKVLPHTEDIICYSVELFSEVPFMISCFEDDKLNSNLFPLMFFDKVKIRNFSISYFDSVVKENINFKLIYKSITIKDYIELYKFPVITDRSQLFEGYLKTSPWSTKYINRDQIPVFSTCFAIFDFDLEMNNDEKFGGVYYIAGVHRAIIKFLKVKYVGLKEPIQIIPKGTLIRFSLARWWKKNEDSEEQCTLQLSGWYNDITQSVFRADYVCDTKSGENSWWKITSELESGIKSVLPGLMRFEGAGEEGEHFEFHATEIRIVGTVLPSGEIFKELVAY
jgi:hypothetical protein